MDSKFNRNYRVMWSEPLGQWVVASELASPGGKGKSRGAASRILCAALVAGGMMAAAPEDAAALTGTGSAATVCTGTAATISAPLTGQCVAKATDRLTLSNTGSILGSSLPGTVVVDPYSTGVTIDNSGTIAAAGTGAGIGAGIDIYANAASIPTGTTITNRAGATITGYTSNYKVGYGILFGGSWPNVAGLDGTLTNAGTINANVSRSLFASAASAYGIYNQGALSGTLDNSGTIRAAASVSGFTGSNPNVSAYGVVNTGVSGTLRNSGTISAAATDADVATGSNSVYVVGVSDWGGGLSGSMTNSGTISATATENGTNTASSMNVRAFGVGSVIQAGGLLTNSGSISATAVNNGKASTSNVSVSAYGLSGGLLGTLTNTSTGTISATAVNHGTGTREMVTAWGVKSDSLTGTLTNDGTISASASNDGSATLRVRAYGVDVFRLNAAGLISNTGSISAGGTGTAKATFYGLYIGNMSGSGGTVNNSGTISASPNAGTRSTAYSLYQANAGGGSGTINNQASGMLSGNLFVADPYATVNNAGTIALPANATVNTIAGDYNQTAGGVLAVDVYSTASYGKLGVGKTADVSTSGNIRVHVPAGNTLVVGDVLPGVLTAATFVPATTYTVTDDSTAFDFTAATNAAGTGVDLTVVAQAPAPAAAPVADSGGCLIQPDAGLDTVLPMTLMGALMLLLGRIFGVRKEDN